MANSKRTVIRRKFNSVISNLNTSQDHLIELGGMYGAEYPDYALACKALHDLINEVKHQAETVRDRV